MSLEIRIDRGRCIGSGVCVRVAPGVFELDDEGIAIVLDPRAASRTELVAAAEMCPTFAIVLVHDASRIR